MSQLKVNSIVPVGGVASGQGGGIIQTIQTFKDGIFSTSSNSYVDITGLSVAIEPKAANSKILIITCAGLSCTGATSVHFLNLLRGSPPIAQPSATSTFGSTSTTFIGSANTMQNWSYNFLDSPTYTVGDTITYKWQLRGYDSADMIVNDRNAGDMKRTATMIAKEVST